MTTGSLAGFPASAARVQIPSWGAWWADVDLVEPEALTGFVPLVLGDLTLQGTIVSGGVADGRAAYRIVGGRAGWGKTLKSKAYRNDLGVKTSLVLGDAAAEAGETLSGSPATPLGPHYARVTGTASSSLNALAPRNWYVDFAGVTQIGQRPITTYAGDAPRTRLAPGALAIDIATDELAALVPGVKVDGSLPASDVEYALSGSRLTATVYAGARQSRRLDAFARLLDAIDPTRRYRALYEFRVLSQSGERYNLQPVRAAVGMPELAGVPVRPGMAGLKAAVVPGELVLVAFADGDPSRPCVVAHDAPDAPGWMPLVLELGAAPTLGVARQTDPVVAGPFAGTITLGSARIKAGL